MRQYFINEILTTGSNIVFSGDVAHHIKDVLRMKNDDEIRLVDDVGHIFLGKLVFDDNGVSADIFEEISGQHVNQPTVVCAALIKKDKWELMLQKAAELGATLIVPIITNRTIIHLEDKEIDKKLERWNKILLEACQQCNRSDICKIVEPVKLKDIDKYKSNTNILAYENEDGSHIVDYDLTDSVTIVIGPEGGFEYKEVEMLKEKGFNCASLGNRILRAETAVMYGLSVIDGERNRNEVCNL